MHGQPHIRFEVIAFADDLLIVVKAESTREAENITNRDEQSTNLDKNQQTYI